VLASYPAPAVVILMQPTTGATGSTTEDRMMVRELLRLTVLVGIVGAIYVVSRLFMP
jgi:hypothetical protein